MLHTLVIFLEVISNGDLLMVPIDHLAFPANTWIAVFTSKQACQIRQVPDSIQGPE